MIHFVAIFFQEAPLDNFRIGIAGAVALLVLDRTVMLVRAVRNGKGRDGESNLIALIKLQSASLDELKNIARTNTTTQQEMVQMLAVIEDRSKRDR